MMPLRFPGSSEQTPAGDAVAFVGTASPAGVAATLVPEDDEPLPELHERDDLQLLVQSPYRLYAYWQHAHDPQATLRRAFGAAAADYQLAVCLLDADSGPIQINPAPATRNCWFDVQPGRAYRAEVGFAAADRPFVRLLASAEARTPPVSVAPASDERPEFQASANEFARVVNETGYAGDALAIALEATDESNGHEHTLTLAHALTAAVLPALGPAELAELRMLIVALVFAEPLPLIRARLASSSLARWLDALLAEQGTQLDQARLLELLRALFGFELEIDEEAQAATLRPTSFAWSASAVRQPERRVRVWLPSMTPGRAALPPLQTLQPSSVGGSQQWLPSMSVRQQQPLLRWRF